MGVGLHDPFYGLIESSSWVYLKILLGRCIIVLYCIEYLRYKLLDFWKVH